MNDLDTVLRQHVKRTPELPESGRCLLWGHDGFWYEAEVNEDERWQSNLGEFDITDGQYWLPMSTFDPSEV